MIRIAEEKDLQAIVGIYNESIPGRMATADTEAVTLDSRLQWFTEHKGQRPLWVFEKDQEIAGWLSLQNFYGRPAYQKTAEISIYVKPKFKQQGIAKELLSFALETCPKLNVTTLLGFIFGHNQPSIKLFSSFGFKEWGYLPKIAELDNQEKDLAIYGLRLEN